MPADPCLIRKNVIPEWPKSSSKKLENHCHALALYFVWYNFARLHKTLRVTPAMEAGLADQAWTMEDMAALIEAQYRPKPRGPYKKKVQPENSN